jgi:hypothetical protein
MDVYKDQRELAATLYPIIGLEGVPYVFRVLKVRERTLEDSLRPIRMQRWADRLWRWVLKCPVYPASGFESPTFLIPEGDSPPVGRSVQIEDVPDRVYHIDITEQVVEVDINNAFGTERELVCRMLERPFTDRFRHMADKFWRAEWTLFFKIVPENEITVDDTINAYRGLKFGVVLLDVVGPCFAADPRTRYVGRKSLAEYTEEEKQVILQNHLDLSIPFKDRASFIRDNGPLKIPCRYAGDAGLAIGQYKYDETGRTVYQYYREAYPNVTVSRDDATIFAQDRSNEEQSWPVPISRLFPVFTTEYEGMRSCSIHPQMTPQTRVAEIEHFLKYLTSMRYGDITISIKSDHLVKERTVFIPPRLEFGKSEILASFPKSFTPSASSSVFDSQIVNFTSRKLPALYKAGPYHNEPLRDVILLYPQTVDRPTRETFLHDLSLEIKRQTGRQPNIAQQRAYSVGQSERMGSSLIRLATEVRLGNPRCLAVVILWDNFNKNVHGELKEAIKPVLSQCITERTVKAICTRANPQRATSQIRNTALAVLIENGIKPWVLADSLHYDLYVGIDTLFGRIGYHFFYGTGGRLVESHYGQSIARGRMKEAIKEPILRRRLEESIISIVNSGYQIGSIAIHRDGRWWPSESAALHRAVERLIANRILAPDIHCAAVEIRKNHIPVRIFTLAQDATGKVLQNPLPGTYLVLDQRKILLTTTGRPGAWDRRGVTAGALLLEVVDCIGEVDIEKIAEDAYHLTHLNWNAPDIEIGLPVTIRWTDEALRETLRSPAEDEEDEAEWEHEDVGLVKEADITNQEEEST